MTGASKILTVSYGTFSCTLEGFDDPFNTMKAIAEYFRDLAAGDRYFGAEPPVPDAAMLHRIAEREIHRRVEAKIQDNGVILRAGDAADALPDLRPSVTEAFAVAPAAQATDAAAESVAARLQRIRAKHTVATPAITAPAVDLADSYSEDQHAEEPGRIDDAALGFDRPFHDDTIDISDQLEEILDEAENDQAAPDLATRDLAALTVASLVPQDETYDDFAAHSEAAVDLPQTASVLTEPAQAEAVSVADDDFDLDADDLDDTQDQADTDAILAGLASDLPEQVSETVDDIDAESTMLSRLSDVAVQVAAPINDAPAARDAGTQTAAPQQAQDDALLAKLGALIDPDDADGDDTAVDDNSDTNQAITNDADLRTAEAPFLPVDEVADEMYAPLAAEPVDAPAAQAAPRARARVIRIRRSEAAAAAAQSVAAQPIEAQPAAIQQNSVLSDEAEAALQAELAALEAELGGPAPVVAPAIVEAKETAPLDLPAATPADVAEIISANAPDPSAPAPLDLRKPITAPTQDDAVSRLIAHANSEMGDADNRRRQSAIAHLKAAVAATEADRKVTGNSAPPAEQRMEPYRNDLERAVRPRRIMVEGDAPRASTAAAAEAAANAPANAPVDAPVDAPPRNTPLVLVSEQRIDRPRDAETPTPTAPRLVLPVRPRRVTASDSVAAVETAVVQPRLQSAPQPARVQPQRVQPAAVKRATLDTSARAVIANRDQIDADEDEMFDADAEANVFSDARSFEEFADQLGATTLPDLLEAAAVYCAEVLQRPEFSRPLVMRQIAGLQGKSEVNREDYLRGFGSLLRQGRIAKVKRGMFALTDRSPYLAEARKIAG